MFNTATPATESPQLELRNGHCRQSMSALLKQAIMIFLLLTVLTGVIYPAVVTCMAQALWPHQANGSLIVENGKTVGSELLGQNFTDPAYFWSRLSATTPPYNAAASSGSNLGPTNKALFANMQARAEALRKADPENKAAIPIDLVTSSGSGLDPDISVESAKYQITRVAAQRHLNANEIEQLIMQVAKPRQFGVFGDPTVNVLKLNLLLDKMSASRSTAR